jgi:hypothetical protein
MQSARETTTKARGGTDDRTPRTDSHLNAGLPVELQITKHRGFGASERKVGKGDWDGDVDADVATLYLELKLAGGRAWMKSEEERLLREERRWSGCDEAPELVNRHAPLPESGVFQKMQNPSMKNKGLP